MITGISWNGGLAPMRPPECGVKETRGVDVRPWGTLGGRGSPKDRKSRGRVSEGLPVKVADS